MAACYHLACWCHGSNATSTVSTCASRVVLPSQQAKPVDETSLPGRSIQKLLILPQHTTAALYSKKLGWGILRLQFVAGYNWKLRKCMLDYRWVGVRSECGCRLEGAIVWFQHGPFPDLQRLQASSRLQLMQPQHICCQDSDAACVYLVRESWKRQADISERSLQHSPVLHV